MLVFRNKCHLNGIYGEVTKPASLDQDYGLDNSKGTGLSLSLGLNRTLWKKPCRCGRAPSGEGNRTSDFIRNHYEAIHTKIIGIHSLINQSMLKGNQCLP